MGEILTGKLVEMLNGMRFCGYLTKLFIRNKRKRRIRTFFAGLIFHSLSGFVKKNFGADMLMTSAPKIVNGGIQL